jgi:phytoene synthase
MTDDDLAYCADQVRAFDRDRWLASLFAPEDRRRDLLVLAAFDLELARVGHSVTQEVIGAIRLQWWRDAFDAMERGTTRAHPVVRAMASLRERRDVPRKVCDELIDARECDLHEKPFADHAAMLNHAQQTGGAWTLLTLSILGVPHASISESMRDAGAATSLVTILRGAARDATRRRFVLPLDAVGGDAAPFESWFAGRTELAFRNAIDAVVDAARGRLDRRFRRVVNRDAFAAFVPVVLARRRLAVIERAGADLFSPVIQAERPIEPLELAMTRLLGRW